MNDRLGPRGPHLPEFIAFHEPSLQADEFRFEEFEPQFSCPVGEPSRRQLGVERIYGEGRNMACLYADLRNPASNRCYTKIGFTPVCGSLHFHKVGAIESPAAGRRNE